jgi:Tol biopolymer transport system component
METDGEDTNPSWAPDSRHLVFASDRDRTAEEQLFVLDLDTGTQTRVPTETSRANFGADW